MSDQSECDNLGSWFNSNPSNPVIENDGLPSSNVKRIGVFTMEKYYFNDFVHHVNTHSIFYSEKDAITAILPYARRVIMILNVAKREAYIKENDSEVTGIRWTELTSYFFNRFALKPIKVFIVLSFILSSSCSSLSVL